MDKKEITEKGYDVEDVGVFLEFYGFGWKNFTRSSSLRQQYKAWKEGKIAIGAVIINTDITLTTVVPI